MVRANMRSHICGDVCVHWNKKRVRNFNRRWNQGTAVPLVITDEAGLSQLVDEFFGVESARILAGHDGAQNGQVSRFETNVLVATQVEKYGGVLCDAEIYIRSQETVRHRNPFL